MKNKKTPFVAMHPKLATGPATIHHATKRYSPKLQQQIWAFINGADIEIYVNAFRERFPAENINTNAVSQYRAALHELQEILHTEGTRHRQTNTQYAIDSIASTLTLHNTITNTTSPDAMAAALETYQTKTQLPRCEKVRMACTRALTSFTTLVASAYLGSVTGLLIGTIASEIAMAPAIIPITFLAFGLSAAIGALGYSDHSTRQYKTRLSSKVPSYFFARCSLQAEDITEATTGLMSAKNY